MNTIKRLLFFILILIPHEIISQVDIIVPVNDSLRNEFASQFRETPIYVRKQPHITEEEMRGFLDALPAFAVYRDVFFVTGIPLNTGINCHTADAMFQFSIRQRLTKSYLPFNTFAYLTFSQKSFWDVYAESSPFKDNNYNPGIGFGRYIIHNNTLRGAAFMQVEHESNGKEGEDSRSWNYLSFSMKYFYNLRLSLGVKVWIPFVDGGENKDLLDYRGLGTFSANFISRTGKWWFSAEVNPRRGWGNANTICGLAFRVSHRHNQYLFTRFYNGKGDSLLEYNQYAMNIRIGICIKPDFYSVY